MIVGTGIDSIEISRMEETFLKRGEQFRDRVFSAAEIAYCEQRASKFASYAVRFAAKEAVMKALGTGWAEGVAWRDIEVIRNEKGPPTIKLGGRALELFNEMGGRRVHLSLTHTQKIAIAQVILES